MLRPLGDKWDKREQDAPTVDSSSAPFAPQAPEA